MDFAADLTTDSLAPPTLLVKKDFAQSTIYLEWNDNSNDETSFVIERCTGSGCSGFGDLDTVTTIYGNVLLLGMNEASWAGSPTTDEAIDYYGSANHGTAFGGARGRTDVPRIVDWYMEGRINIDDLITHKMPLDEINTAFDLMHKGESIRSVVEY